MSQYRLYADEIKTHVKSIDGNIPLHRKESRRVYRFSRLPLDEQLAIWDLVWRTSHDFYLRLHATFFLERHMKNEGELRVLWMVVVKWQDYVDDWPLCDALAKIYTRILELSPAEIYAQLRRWNRDADLWKRRQSVVSLLYYSRTKGKYIAFVKITALITPLLGDKEYYVQKGVGWSLREMHNVYPEKTLTYVKKHIKAISATAFVAAVEKMDAEVVKELKGMRKECR
jgi:3-methyladenine DNA glycosylase AlkD